MRKFDIGLCLLVIASLLCSDLVSPAAAQDNDDEMPSEAVLRWSFQDGMALHFRLSNRHRSRTEVKGTTEGAVLRLVAALTHADPEINEKAAELLKKGGQPVLEVLTEYMQEEASREERLAIMPIIEHLQEHPDPEATMPDRFPIAERLGDINCNVLWEVENVRGARATVHVTTHNINVAASQRSLGQEDFERATFVQGQTTGLNPANGQQVVLEEPTDPVAAQFFNAMQMDYRFGIDLNERDVYSFRFSDEAREDERRAMNLTDPLQIGPSFRRLPGTVVPVGGEEWQVAFEFFTGPDGNRVHLCDYHLESIQRYKGRRCAQIKWREGVYQHAPRSEYPGEAIGGGSGEFWMDIDNNVLVYHEQDIAFENATVLRIPRSDNSEEVRELETYFMNVINMEMELQRVTHRDDGN